MINPDVMPLWLAAPAAFLAWGSWAVILLRERRRSRRGR